jgi:outer membrane protein TolC
MVILRKMRGAAELAVSLMLLAGLLAPVGFSRGRALGGQQSQAEQSQSRQGQDQPRTTEQPGPGDPPQPALNAPIHIGFPDTGTLSEFANPKSETHAPRQEPAKPAQSKNPPAELDKSAITTPIPETKPVGPERTGVELNLVEDLTLQDAIRLALLNNLTIEQFRQGVQMAQYSLFSTRGVYDVTSGATISFLNDTTPTAIIPADSGAINGAYTYRTFAANFTTSQNFQPTGGSWVVSFNNARTVQTSTIDLLSPQYSATLQVSIVQPLMRNLSIDANRQTIQIAKAQLDLSDSQFRQQVIQIINQVQDAYWELGYAIQNEKIARNTFDLTHKQLEDNRKQIEAGTLAPLDLRQTEATLEANKGTIIAAKQTVTNDENALKILLLKDPNDRIWNSIVKPLDDPEFESHSFSLSDAIALALKNRPELEQIRLQKLQNRININYYKNQLKPQLNLVALYSTTGLAGTPGPASILEATPGGFDQLVQGSALSDLTDIQAKNLIASLNSALSGLGLKTFNPVLPPPTLISEIPGRFSGGYGTVLGQLFGENFRTIQVGLTFSFPWRNRTAEGNLGQALALERQTEAAEKALVTQIGINVRNALEAVEAARESYLAAVAGKEAAYAQYVGEEEKFRAGLSTTFFVLQQETAYATAQGTEARARANYRQALSDFQRVTATTLVSNNVEIPATSQQPGQNQNP